LFDTVVGHHKLSSLLLDDTVLSVDLQVLMLLFLGFVLFIFDDELFGSLVVDAIPRSSEGYISLVGRMRVLVIWSMKPGLLMLLFVILLNYSDSLKKEGGLQQSARYSKMCYSYDRYNNDIS